MPSCAVFKCSNRFSQGKRLFQIPSNPILYKKWETFLIKSGTKYISKHSKVCEDHFTFTFCNDIPLRNKVPTIFLSKSSIAEINPKDKKNLLQKNLESFHSMCRICLFDATESWVSINSSSKALGGLSVREVVYKCFNIYFRSSENVSEKVCGKCYESIIKVHTLQNRILNSEKQVAKIESMFTHSKDLVNETQCSEIERVLIVKNEIQDESFNDSNGYAAKDMLYEEITIKKENEETEEFNHENLSQPSQNQLNINESLPTQIMKTESSPAVKKKSVNIFSESSDDEPLLKKSGNGRSCEVWPELLQKQEERQKELNKHKTCKNCNFVADNILELHRHIDDSKNNCSDLYNPKKECFICHRKFMLLVKKYEHVKKDHQDCVLRDCHLCLKSKLKNPVTYEKHLSRHYRSPDFVCNQCGREFYKKESWEIHMLNHDENYWLTCDLCSYKCKTKCSLKIHMIYHLQIKSAICEYCSKCFTSGPVLRKHHFQHHKIFPKRYNRCAKCDYCFLYRPQYERHLPHCDGTAKNPILGTTKVRFVDLVQK